MNSELFCYSISLCALVGSYQCNCCHTSSPRGIEKEMGRPCQSKSRMKCLASYIEYFREWSVLADGARVHMLVKKISPQIMSELLNY